MRFKYRKEYDERVVKRFALLPIKYDGAICWLEWVYYLKRYEWGRGFRHHTWRTDEASQSDYESYLKYRTETGNKFRNTHSPYLDTY